MNVLRVRDLMTDKVLSVRPGDTVDKIYDAMNERSIRHIAVIDDEGDLVGVVTHRDLLRHALSASPPRPRTQLLELFMESLDDDLGIGDEAGVRGQPQPHVAGVAHDADAEPQLA